MYIKDIQEACRKVLQGDQEALERLWLDNYKYPKPKAQSTATSTLQLQYNCTLCTAVAARELNLHFLEKQCVLTLEYIQAIAEAKHVTLQNSVHHEDVAEIMLSLIDQEKRKYMKEGKEGNHADSESEEEEESDCWLLC